MSVRQLQVKLPKIICSSTNLVHKQPNSIKHHFQISAKEHQQTKAWKLINSVCPYSRNIYLYIHLYVSHEAFYMFLKPALYLFLSPVFPVCPHSSSLYSHLFILKLLPDNWPQVTNMCLNSRSRQSSLFLICTFESNPSELKLP